MGTQQRGLHRQVAMTQSDPITEVPLNCAFITGTQWKQGLWSPVGH